MPMRFPLAALATALVVAAVFLPASPAEAAPRCAQDRATPAYAGSVLRALRSKRDLWGEQLIRRPGGPTYASVRRLLKPLLFARARSKPLTSSGVYYLPFAQPLGSHGALDIALHVADGSQILARTAAGASLRVLVGPGGHEPFGSCLARLSQPTLAEGYLPILETRYRDSAGVRYGQESFAVRGLGTGVLISFVSVTASAAKSGALVRLVHSTKQGVRSAQAGHEDSALRYRVEPGQTATLYVAWLPGDLRPVVIDADTYQLARDRLVEFWNARLGEAVKYDVPETVVMDAQKSLLEQDLALTWRYSVGNPYEEFSSAESLDVAEVMGSYGFTNVMRQILRTSFGRFSLAPSNWRMGELMIASARYYELTGDRPYLNWVTKRVDGFMTARGRQMRNDPHGLLRQERFSSDIPDRVYGLHSQTTVWEGLNAMGAVWTATTQPAHAARARGLANRLRAGLQRAVAASSHRLKDGSLFVPAVLLAKHKPFDAVTRSRLGSYWNLVMPYALASGFFEPHGRQANEILRYMLAHGSRLLGLVRAGAYSLYGGKSRYPVTGTDQVYGLAVARFLADNDQPDQLVLSLYGMLGAAMTPGTFVSGEAATVAPLEGAAFRSMYLPPNAASNSAFLETLRLMLVHETTAPNGRPVGLELAFGTPRGWLAPGKSVAVRESPTSFGPLSYEIDAGYGQITATVDVPAQRPPLTMKLRLRVPAGHRVLGVRVDGKRRPFDRKTATVDLSGLRGTLSIIAAVR
jgi:hypothetical protein